MRQAAARAEAALAKSVEGLTLRTKAHDRVARIAVLARVFADEAVDFVLGGRRVDGGWVDNEDSIWCAALLGRERPDSAESTAANRWLDERRTTRGGWGRNERDEPRIPLTAVAVRFLPATALAPSDQTILETMWRTDLESTLQLSYKAGFYLSCQAPHEPSQLAARTVRFLEEQQNQDGGFAPWKGHPIGSDPWSTGVCLAGLCRFPGLTSQCVVDRAAGWLKDTQLDSGYWPCHFIDEGTAYALWGLSEAIAFLGAK